MTFDLKSSAGSERMPEGAVGLLGRTMLVLQSFSLLKILRLLKRAIVLPTSPTRQDVGVGSGAFENPRSTPSRQFRPES